MATIPLTSETLRTHVVEDVLGFWVRHGLDEATDTYRHGLGRRGEATDENRHLVTQTRILYAFAEGFRITGDPQWLDHAERARRFLQEAFADRERGGYFWEVTARGEPLQLRKRAYGHAFAAYALAVLAQLTKDDEPARQAAAAWAMLRERFFDPDFGGVTEELSREWEPHSDHKTLSTHLHVVEATLEQCRLRAADGPIVELRALCDVVAERIFGAQNGCAGERFAPDWTPTDEPPWVGHNLEAAWFLWQTGPVADRPEYAGIARRLVDWSLECGWDDTQGAFHNKVSPGGQAVDATKVWWVQTEGLIALLTAWEATGEHCYRHRAERLWDFCDAHLIDHEHGEWFGTIAPDGSRHGDAKGHAWKGPYHVVQALSSAARLLR